MFSSLLELGSVYLLYRAREYEDLCPNYGHRFYNDIKEK